MGGDGAFYFYFPPEYSPLCGAVMSKDNITVNY